MESPIGPLCIVVDELDAVRQIHFGNTTPAETLPAAASLGEQAEQQLQQYFCGQRREFDLRLAPRGTEFQQAVWAELQRIPYGTTKSYLQIAKALGKPEAIRAVGAANGANPIAIVIPCHRVIGSNGKLTGYAGGLDVKQKLLETEGVLPVTLL